MRRCIHSRTRFTMLHHFTFFGTEAGRTLRARSLCLLYLPRTRISSRSDPLSHTHVLASLTGAIDAIDMIDVFRAYCVSCRLLCHSASSAPLCTLHSAPARLPHHALPVSTPASCVSPLESERGGVYCVYYAYHAYNTPCSACSLCTRAHPAPMSPRSRGSLPVTTCISCRMAVRAALSSTCLMMLSVMRPMIASASSAVRYACRSFSL